MDTNVVDKFLRQSSENFSLFRSIKKNKDIQFVVSMDLLSELVANPNPEKAKEALRIVRELCSPQLFLLDLVPSLRSEINSFFSGKAPQRYYSRKDATSIFEERIWGNLISNRLKEINEWRMSRKKEWFLKEKIEHKETLKDIGDLSSEYCFTDVYNAMMASGYSYRFLEGLVSRILRRKIADDQFDALMRNLQILPTLHAYLLYDVSYFMFYGLKGNRLDKAGNAFDARHAVSASNSNYFLSGDIKLIEMLRCAAGYWNFEPMFPGEFCDKYRA